MFLLIKIVIKLLQIRKVSPLREGGNWIRKGHREEASALPSVFRFLRSVLVPQTLTLSLLNSTCMYQPVSVCVCVAGMALCQPLGL